jgi:hypothetical protein
MIFGIRNEWMHTSTHLYALMACMGTTSLFVIISVLHGGGCSASFPRNFILGEIDPDNPEKENGLQSE